MFINPKRKKETPNFQGIGVGDRENNPSEATTTPGLHSFAVSHLLKFGKASYYCVAGPVLIITQGVRREPMIRQGA